MQIGRGDPAPHPRFRQLLLVSPRDRAELLDDRRAARGQPTAELRRRIEGGEWVVDLRNRVAFAGGHLAGTRSVEHGPMFTTFLGWALPWGDPITLVGSEEQVTAAVRDLHRIGIDHPDVAIGPDVAALGDGLHCGSGYRPDHYRLSNSIR